MGSKVKLGATIVGTVFLTAVFAYFLDPRPERVGAPVVEGAPVDAIVLPVNPSDLSVESRAVESPTVSNRATAPIDAAAAKSTAHPVIDGRLLAIAAAPQSTFWTRFDAVGRVQVYLHLDETFAPVDMTEVLAPHGFELEIHNADLGIA